MKRFLFVLFGCRKYYSLFGFADKSIHWNKHLDELGMYIEMQWMKKLAKPTPEQVVLGNTIINLTAFVRIRNYESSQ